ncbi:hypothetical protein ALC56_12019 [Trachymyrmex septentrionalis]|uniref:Uncharacterized protein n=1 Tax=Trachymyrmex septentrionalis TaxID=34720 RepID=A0A195F079_9HYME|nr:hypothetical protein ALC56_12019 [Trachymyrmex septentrionalis]
MDAMIARYTAMQKSVRRDRTVWNSLARRDDCGADRLAARLAEIGDVQVAVIGVSTTNQMYPRLIPVHRVQYNLQQRKDLPFDYCSSQWD